MLFWCCLFQKMPKRCKNLLPRSQRNTSCRHGRRVGVGPWWLCFQQVFLRRARCESSLISLMKETSPKENQILKHLRRDYTEKCHAVMKIKYSWWHLKFPFSGERLLHHRINQYHHASASFFFVLFVCLFLGLRTPNLITGLSGWWASFFSLLFPPFFGPTH